MRATEDRFERLASQFAPDLLAYFAARVVPAQDAADLLNETLLVGWRRYDALPSDDREARMWLYGVARKVLSTHRRGQVRRAALAGELRASCELNARVGDADPDPRVVQLRRELANLAPLDMEIVRLVHWDELSLVECARHLGKREGTIRSRYHRARQRLREGIGERRMQTERVD